MFILSNKTVDELPLQHHQIIAAQLTRKFSFSRLHTEVEKTLRE